MKLNDERLYPYNQSSNQSIFFVNQVFSNGELLNSDFYILNFYIYSMRSLKLVTFSLKTLSLNYNVF